jgi:hypothetical protein
MRKEISFVEASVPSHLVALKRLAKVVRRGYLPLSEYSLGVSSALVLLGCSIEGLMLQKEQESASIRLQDLSVRILLCESWDDVDTVLQYLPYLLRKIFQLEVD